MRPGPTVRTAGMRRLTSVKTGARSEKKIGDEVKESKDDPFDRSSLYRSTNKGSFAINTTNPLSGDRDVLQHIMHFVQERAFIFVASVSRQWRDAWQWRPKVTSRNLVVQSKSCLDWAKASGLTTHDGPCCRAAAQGRLDVLKHAVALGYSREFMPICEHAAGGGHLEIVKWCRAHNFPWGRSYERAVEGGHTGVLLFCWCNGCHWDESAWEAAARAGHLHILQWWWKRDNLLGKHVFSKMIAAAAGAGHLDIVKWCRSRCVDWAPDTTYWAAKGGHLDTLKWLSENGCPPSTDTMCGAVEAKNLPMLVWCKATGFPWPQTICGVAARCGDLSILQWCMANGSLGSIERPLLCAIAAAHGHLDVLQWCRAMRCPWGRGVCFNAARGGHFEVLKWCVANGCDWGSVFEADIKWTREFKGSVEMMSWATSNGCPWMSSALEFTVICDSAAASGNLELLKCCCLEGLRFKHILVSWATAAASRGQLETLKWLESFGYHWKICRLHDTEEGAWLSSRGWCGLGRFKNAKTICVAAARSGHLEILEWCLDRGYPQSPRITLEAASQQNLEMLAWCRKRGVPLHGMVPSDCTDFQS